MNRARQTSPLPDRAVDGGTMAADHGPLAVPVRTHALVREAVASQGQPLDARVRGPMESHFAHDFSQVRVHTHHRAEESADALGALAYTFGRNVVFAAGQYAPSTGGGRRLIAHELTHVLQQRAGTPVVQRAPSKGSETAAPQLPQKVRGGTTALDRAAQGYRADHPDLPAGTNLVAVEYSVGDGPRHVRVLPNRPGVAHAEAELDEFLRGVRRQARAPITVHEIYSERQPCGPSEHDCEGLLLKRYPQAKTTFGFNYQETVTPADESRASRSRSAIDARHGRVASTKQLEWDFDKQQPPPHHERLEPGNLSSRPRRFGSGRGGSTRAMAEAISKINADTAAAERTTARFRTYVQAYGLLQHALSLLSTLEFAQQVFFHGTVFPKEQAEADRVFAESGDAVDLAEQSGEGRYLGSLAAIYWAREDGDAASLFALESELIKLHVEQTTSSRLLSDMADDLAAQGDDLIRASKNNLKGATQGLDDAAMAQSAALYISTERLGNTLRGAADRYHSAAQALDADAALINSAANSAEDAGWTIRRAQSVEEYGEAERRRRAAPQPMVAVPASPPPSHTLAPRGSGPGGALTDKDKAALLKFLPPR